MTSFGDIEISIIYNSESGKEIPFLEIIQQKDIMDIEHYQPRGFWNIHGGLKITGDNYNTVFNSTNFHHLTKATNFLIHSLYWINGKRSDWFDLDDDYPDDIVIRTMSGQLLRLTDHGESEIALSFSDPDRNHLRQRGEHYFENIVIAKPNWYKASEIALTEYFEILQKVLQRDPTDSNSKTMSDYYSVWKNR